MNKNLQIGVIGLGRLGYQHAANIRRAIGADLVAISDPSNKALERGEKDFNVVAFSDYKQMLSEVDLDAVVVATPTQTHYDILIDVINAGLPIFCEKPITYTLEEAKKILDLVTEKNHFIQIGYMRRFDPGHVKAKELIMSGKLGDPIYLHDCQRDPNGPPPEYVPMSGGLFVDMAIHDLDVARWIMGSEITEVYAQGAVLKHEYLKELNDIDDGQILLKFANGSLGMIEISRNACNVYDVRTEVVCKEKSVFVGQNQLTPYTLVGDEEITVDMSNWVLDRFKDAYEQEIQAFVDSVRNSEKSKVNAYDGYMGLKLALAATESYRTGSKVVIDF
ncbi:MAG: Gfo/Idh/MocA family oxidoreductase [Clostridiaceae bacterium]|jgi:scyllo-inositol 2-dehydrogenase (NAD+)|nr:Gfo/Idh/MocA family oxidoreductase [Clostridiaceae bacterium]